MNIFDEVKQVIDAIPQTPREFLVEHMGEDWQHAMICRYPVGQEQCYIGLLLTVCPDCQEQQTRIAVFAPCEQGFRFLQPAAMEMPL